MALFTCPECGKQISDKAVKCPNCGIGTQEALAEVQEKQKKRKRRTILSIVSVCIVVTLAVLAYLYYTDALNSIPADYRKHTEACFADCESAIQNGNFKSANEYLNTLKSRTLTNRQAKHAKEMEKALAELGLSGLENIEQTDLSYRDIQMLTQDLQAMDLSESQKARFDIAIKEAERIKRPRITASGVEPFLLDASFQNIPPQGDYYDHIVLGRFYVVMMGEAGDVEITEEELDEYYDWAGSYAEVLTYFGSGIVMQGTDTMLIAKYDERGSIFEVEVFSKEISFENGIHVGMSSETMGSQYNASFLTTADWFEGFIGMCFYVKEIPQNITLWATNDFDIFDGEDDWHRYPTSGELIKNTNCIFSYKVPMDKVKDNHLKSIRIMKKDYECYIP